MQSLEKHAFPEIGALRVNTIGQDDVLCILKPLWSTRPQLACKLRQRIRATLQWCQAHGHVGTNVAGEAIDGALPAMPGLGLRCFAEATRPRPPSAQAVTTGTSYLAISGSRVTSTNPPNCACTTSKRSKGSRWCMGSSAHASTWERSMPSTS